MVYKMGKVDPGSIYGLGSHSNLDGEKSDIRPLASVFNSGKGSDITILEQLSNSNKNNDIKIKLARLEELGKKSL